MGAIEVPHAVARRGFKTASCDKPHGRLENAPRDASFRGPTHASLPMKSFGKRAAGLRLERMKASPMWSGEGFRNIHPVLPGLRERSER